MTEIRKTQNTTGMIQGAAQKAAPAATAIAPAGQERLKDLITTEQVQTMFRNALKERADQFLASVVDLYNNDKTLQLCRPSEVLAEAFKAATLDLPINKQLGFAYIVPFKDNKQGGKSIPTFQLGYKGYIQLCQRTGAYRFINAGPAYEGEFVSENRLTGAIDLSGKRISDKLVGFFGYIETLNGFSKSIYWSVEKMNAHAKRYSKSFGYDSSPWRTNYEEMGTKTVLRNLLSKWGVMSIDMLHAEEADYNDAADAQIAESQSEVAPATQDVTPPDYTGTDDEDPYAGTPMAEG